jgi:hypothetical protein
MATVHGRDEDIGGGLGDGCGSHSAEGANRKEICFRCRPFDYSARTDNAGHGRSVKVGGSVTSAGCIKRADHSALQVRMCRVQAGIDHGNADVAAERKLMGLGQCQFDGTVLR